MNTIESRITALERQLRSLLVMMAGVLVVLVALLAYGATDGILDEIRTRKLIVVSKSGQEVVKLESGKFGGYLTIGNNDGQPSILLSALPLSAGLVALLDASGTPRVQMSIDPTARTGSLRFTDEDGNILLSVMSGLKGRSYLHIRNGGEFSILNDNGKEVVRVFSDDSGDGAVIVGNRNGRSRVLSAR